MECSIIVTIGPSSIDKTILNNLLKAGASSFRINLSHSNEILLTKYYDKFRSCNIQPSIDTQGAQVRICEIPSNEKFLQGQKILLSDISSPNKINSDLLINHSEFFSQMEVGDILKLGFDGLTGKVVSVDKKFHEANIHITSDGPISINKAIDISEKSIELEPLTNFDKYAIKNSHLNNVDTIYLSFCNNKEAISQVKELIDINYPASCKKPKVIAKIETKKALMNLKSIARNCDGILIDRGDLSREVRISQIPAIVDEIIYKCKELNTPCYIATNILDQMIKEALPSRAEISDIYNLLNKGVSGIVLAAEVAIGLHPVECVQVIKYMSLINLIEKRKLSISEIDKQINLPLPYHLKAWL